MPLSLSQPVTASPQSAADVMVVDDTPANLHLFIKLLTAQGYHIRPITEGAQAIAAAQANPPDVILLDIKMPEMDGYEVCRQLKAHTSTCNIPVIFLTVLDDEDSIVKGFEVGGVDYITKPVRERELLARVKSQLELRSLQKRLSEKNKQQEILLAQYEAADTALKESEEKFSTAFQNTPLPTTIVDLKNEQYVDINEAFVQQTGYSREETIGRTATELGLWQSLEQRAAAFAQLKAKGYVHGVEVNFYNRSGKTSSVILFLELIYFNGEPYVLATGKDITQQKADQKKLIDQTQALSQTLKTLQTTQAELIRAAKMAALGNLVAGVAHEISTPVGTAVMTASTLENATQSIAAELQRGELKRSSFEGYIEVATECSRLMLNNLTRAGELINSFKKVAVDQTSVQRRAFLIKPYVQEVVANLLPQFKKTPHKTKITGDDTLLIESYPGSLAQIVTNLTTNSLIHAYPDNQPGIISITIETQANEVVLTYQDDGCGITPEHQNRIFEPFFTTARDIGGSGLGLHLVYNLVTQTLKGKIQVASSPGQGTTFTIRFPVE
ncbi:MAG: response regulator [Phormidesmis sp.]